ncbi:MAG: cell division protein ZapA [Deltaproteobacteria bacterium]|nr:cell division protein ZapA [Deltaproteobacteria bacterium]
MKKQYHINILEQDLSVLSDSGDDHVAGVVQYVEDKVQQIRSAANSINTLNIAILVALNIADEYLKLAGTNKEMCDELVSRTENLICLIDDV